MLEWEFGDPVTTSTGGWICRSCGRFIVHGTEHTCCETEEQCVFKYCPCCGKRLWHE